MKYAFILKHSKEFSVNAMCRVLLASKSGYYNSLQRNHDPESQDKKNYLILRTIEKIFQGSRQTYGSPRIYRQLKALGFSASKSKVERIMKKYGIVARKKRKFKPRTTDSSNTVNPFVNLVDRKFDRGEVDKVWLSDITYLSMNKKWAYLATVMDAHSRKIIGWSVADNMKTDLVLKALKSAVMHRNYKTEGIIYHSDQGSQYASEQFREKIKDLKMIQSMSRKGNCWDNSPMESFYDTLKCEYTNHEQFENIFELKSSIFEWVEVFYNRQRIHSSIGYLSPACFEEKFMKKAS